MSETAAPVIPTGRPIMSGHCATPATADPEGSHHRCAKMGSGIKTAATKVFHPCPCGCHLDAEEYECSNCGGEIRETEVWLGDGETTYVHIDHDGRATGEDCP